MMSQMPQKQLAQKQYEPKKIPKLKIVVIVLFPHLLLDSPIDGRHGYRAAQTKERDRMKEFRRAEKKKNPFSRSSLF
jgi:hypothetical protein